MNVSDVSSIDSRKAEKRGRPRSSSQPTENEKIIKDHFNSPKRRNKGNFRAKHSIDNFEVNLSLSIKS